MVERLTAAQAASAIVALINNRPTSPWLGEIQAIVERGNAGASGLRASEVICRRS
jgi:hypothetical protein